MPDPGFSDQDPKPFKPDPKKGWYTPRSEPPRKLNEGDDDGEETERSRMKFREEAISCGRLGETLFNFIPPDKKIKTGLLIDGGTIFDSIEDMKLGGLPMGINFGTAFDDPIIIGRPFDYSIHLDLFKDIEAREKFTSQENPNEDVLNSLVASVKNKEILYRVFYRFNPKGGWLKEVESIQEEGARPPDITDETTADDFILVEKILNTLIERINPQEGKPAE